MIEGGKIVKCKDLSYFDKGQIMKARWLVQSISKMLGLLWVFLLCCG